MGADIMPSVENLRVGPRKADELEDARQARVQQALELYEAEFTAAVLTGDPLRQVSRVPVHSGEPETMSVLDLVRDMLDGDDGDTFLHRLLHLLARNDDGESVQMLLELASYHADTQVDLLQQRGAL